MGKMNLLKFCIYTLIGATIWNTFLAYVGIHWGQAGWDLLMKYSHPIDIAIVILLLIGVIYFVVKHIRKK
jgi:membrane protein DedA with SNARE-associated domain